MKGRCEKFCLKVLEILKTKMENQVEHVELHNKDSIYRINQVQLFNSDVQSFVIYQRLLNDAGKQAIMLIHHTEKVM